MNARIVDLMFGTAALFVGYIITDTYCRYRDEKVVAAFHQELDANSYVPASWRMNPNGLT